MEQFCYLSINGISGITYSEYSKMPISTRTRFTYMAQMKMEKEKEAMDEHRKSLNDYK